MEPITFAVLVGAARAMWMDGTKSGRRSKAWIRKNGRTIWTTAAILTALIPLPVIIDMIKTFWECGIPWQDI